MTRAATWGALRAALLFVLAAIGGCVGGPPGRVSDSQIGYDRTYELVLAAMTDQRLVISAQDRRSGRIVGSADGATLVATIEPIVDGSVRVILHPQAQTPADDALLKRVSDAYNARMAKLSMLGGFKDSGGGSDRGPTPCPSGPAFCP